MRRLAPVAVLLMFLLALLAPTGAQAGEITRVGDQYVYTSTAVAQNTLQLNYCSTCGVGFDNDFLFKDDGEPATIGAGSGCSASALGMGFVQCPAAGIARFTANLGPGNDTVDIGG